ncbi:hypothetical protein PM082_010954 [Marasmius tenuissimus]|nr:hypothetical protein PM082_010954 [Marasmius tenuissimus]
MLCLMLTFKIQINSVVSQCCQKDSLTYAIVRDLSGRPRVRRPLEALARITNERLTGKRHILSASTSRLVTTEGSNGCPPMNMVTNIIFARHTRPYEKPPTSPPPFSRHLLRLEAQRASCNCAFPSQSAARNELGALTTRFSFALGAFGFPSQFKFQSMIPYDPRRTCPRMEQGPS